MQHTAFSLPNTYSPALRPRQPQRIGDRETALPHDGVAERPDQRMESGAAAVAEELPGPPRQLICAFLHGLSPAPSSLAERIGGIQPAALHQPLLRLRPLLV